MFWRAISNFFVRISALREFVQLVRPVVDEASADTIVQLVKNNPIGALGATLAISLQNSGIDLHELVTGLLGNAKAQIESLFTKAREQLGEDNPDGEITWAIEPSDDLSFVDVAIQSSQRKIASVRIDTADIKSAVAKLSEGSSEEDNRDNIIKVTAKVPGSHFMDLSVTSIGGVSRALQIDADEVTIPTMQDPASFVDALYEVLDFNLGMYKTLVRTDLLNETILTSLIGAAECLFSDLLHAYMAKHPKVAKVGGRSLTLDEIDELGSAEKAREYLIDRRIDEIIRDTVVEWLAFLDRGMSLRVDFLKSDMEELEEHWLRRNLIVHAGGYVNEKYLSRVADRLTTGAVIGRRRRISRAYLEGALERIERCFLVVAFELWKQCDRSDSRRPDAWDAVVDDAIECGRWPLVEALGLFMMNDLRQSALDQDFGRLTYWLALKETGRFDGVRQNVSKHDFTTNMPILEAWRRALLGDTDGVLDLLPTCLKSKTLTRKELLEYPVFREVRETERYRREYGGATESAPPSEHNTSEPSTAPEQRAS